MIIYDFQNAELFCFLKWHFFRKEKNYDRANNVFPVRAIVA